MELIQKVRTELKTKRLKGGWFASKIGISHSYLSNIFAGRAPLTADISAKMVKALKDIKNLR